MSHIPLSIQAKILLFHSANFELSIIIFFTVEPLYDVESSKILLESDWEQLSIATFEVPLWLAEKDIVVESCHGHPM